MLKGLLKNSKLRWLKAPVALADDTDDNSAIVDTTGYGGVLFFTTITDSVTLGVGTLTIEQDVANADTNMAALSGAVDNATSVLTDDLNDTILCVDVVKPRERYVQGVRTSATADIAFGDMYCILYNPSYSPVALDSTVQDGTTVISPAES